MGAAESVDGDSVDETKSEVYKMGNIELYYILASVVSAPVIGYLYEMTTR